MDDFNENNEMRELQEETFKSYEKQMIAKILIFRRYYNEK